MKTKTNDIIKAIKERDIDGETMHSILEQTGLDYQMYKQLNVEYRNEMMEELFDENRERVEMIHRLEMINQDVKTLLAHLRKGKNMSSATEWGENGYTHIANIHIALEMDNNEALSWFTKEEKKDTIIKTK
tara:strand:+ start:4409 stop:4801 length:393 start_codon:yes stop_codon:yes gene_type:complete